MKMKKMVAGVLAYMAFLGSVPYYSSVLENSSIIANAGATGVRDSFYYEKHDDYAEILFPRKGTVTAEIPSEIDGLPVTVIGGFYYAADTLKEVIIPDTVTTIRSCAFKECTGLTEIVLPDSITYIDEWTFFDCENLTKVILPSNITSLSNCMFAYCKNLQEITIPESVTVIERQAFAGCESLKEIKLPNNLKFIGDLAFELCTGLTKMTIPENVEEIQESPFYGCKNFSLITISENNPYFVTDGDAIFNKDKTEILCHCTGNVKETYDIPDTVTTIREKAFEYCENLREINIPDSVQSIGERAFVNCSRLETAHIPDGITSLELGVFENCKSLDNIKIPESVITMGYSVFLNCENMGNIFIPDTIETVKGSALSNTKWLKNQPDGLLYIGKTLYTYKGEMPENTIIEVKEGTIYITENACSGYNGLTEVTLPETVKYIEERAFDSYRLKKIKIYNPECEIYPSYFYDTIPRNAVIYGYENSTAQQYAHEWGNKFVVFGTSPDDFDTNTSGVIGDVNDDNVLDVADIVAVASYVGNPEINKLSEQSIKNADVHNTGDGLTAMDILVLQQRIANIDDVIEIS
ncbi:MAG: leucine-rich repeat protein [Oscillospiraceae bacterium]|nr:leucine-rich repeat protein [Oscillospiraceae bacterium]